MRRTDWKPVGIGGEDGAHGDEFGRRALSIGEVGFADLFADRDYDPLPADHGAETERESDRDLDPSGNEPRRSVEPTLVVGDDLLICFTHLRPGLCQDPK